MKKSRSNAAIIAILTIYLVFPLVLTFLYSIFRQWKDVLPSGLTLGYYAELFTDSGFLLPLLNTLLISIVPVALCTVVLLLAMYVAIAHLPWLDRYLQILCTIPYAIQGIILAIGVLSLYSGLPEPFSNRIVMLSFTYCIVVLPYMYRGIKNSLEAIHVQRLLEAAQMLGASRFRAFFAVIVPNILSGITVSVMLSVSLLFGDFVIINILAGSYLQSAQIYLYRLLSESGQRCSAVVCVVFALTLLLTNGALYLVGRASRRRQTPKEI